jgi:hypothetical protein
MMMDMESKLTGKRFGVHRVARKCKENKKVDGLMQFKLKIKGSSKRVG